MKVRLVIQRGKTWGTWVAQSVEHPTPDLCASHNPRVVGLSPVSGSKWSLFEILSLSLCLSVSLSPPSPACALSLSIKIKKKKRGKRRTKSEGMRKGKLQKVCEKGIFRKKCYAWSRPRFWSLHVRNKFMRAAIDPQGREGGGRERCQAEVEQ